MKEKTFGNFLYELRKKNHITQRQLGHFIGVGHRVISKWETGVCLPDAANLLALARFFGVSTDALLKGHFIHTDSRTAEVPLSLLTDTVFAEPEAEGGSGRQSLVPPPSDIVTGNYLCSWYAQQLIAKRLGLTKNRYAELRDTLTAGMLFDDSSEFHPLSREYRKGLIFLVDDGWDVPFGTPSDPANWRRFGSLLPDTERFAALGKTEESRLRGLSEKMKKLGYAGLGLWIAAERAGENPESTRRFYEEHARRHRAADILYWKVDWGDYEKDAAYRQTLTQTAHDIAPGLLVEHCVTQQAVDQANRSPDIKEVRHRLLEKFVPFSDVIRTYDIMYPFYATSTLGRAHEVFSAARENGEGEHGRCLVCAEWAYFVAAALGCTVGIMQANDECRALLRFHRLSPPFGAYEAEYLSSEEVLTDSIYFEKNTDKGMRVGGRAISESAPAVMARGIPLPEVVPCGPYTPFVAASKNPNSGVYAVATFRRNIDPNVEFIAPADVSLRVEGECVTLGVFGFYHTLTLIFPSDIRGTVRVLAQDLLLDSPDDVTTKVVISGNKMTFDGVDLRCWGKKSRPYFDNSNPALLLRIEPVCAESGNRPSEKVSFSR